MGDWLADFKPRRSAAALDNESIWRPSRPARGPRTERSGRTAVAAGYFFWKIFLK
jgi:hypothetical protein